MKDLEKLASEEALSDAGTINNMLADAVIQVRGYEPLALYNFFVVFIYS